MHNKVHPFLYCTCSYLLGLHLGQSDHMKVNAKILAFFILKRGTLAHLSHLALSILVYNTQYSSPIFCTSIYVFLWSLGFCTCIIWIATHHSNSYFSFLECVYYTPPHDLNPRNRELVLHRF